MSVGVRPDKPVGYWPSWFGGPLGILGRDILTMAKPRISTMVLAATLIGYLLAPDHSHGWAYLAILLFATAILGGGANTLNQYIERDVDRLMVRTHARPLPSGRIPPRAAFVGGLLAVGSGIGLLGWQINGLSALIALTVAVTYVAFYTPLKRRSGINTLVGAIPGGLPPVLGWAAAMGSLGIEAAALFMIMFVWQLPHFLAIAWLYRKDYAAARMHMLPVIDPDGSRTSRQLVLSSTVLVPVSLYPSIIGMTGAIYFYGALVLSLLFLAVAVAMAIRASNFSARFLLKYSIIYLPLLFALMFYDKLI